VHARHSSPRRNCDPINININNTNNNNTNTNNNNNNNNMEMLSMQHIQNHCLMTSKLIMHLHMLKS
jgi:hypothetical protein